MTAIATANLAENQLAGSPSNGRISGVDKIRGLAIVCMVVDHVAIVVGGPLAIALRCTIGRLALPLFFVTAGRCSGRVTWRHALAAVVGVLLPLVVPFIDAPNVLVWWALGAVALYLGGTWLAPIAVLVALTLAANDWLIAPGRADYPGIVLVALMGLGALLPWTWWRWGDSLPAGQLLAFLGRHALPIYVGHALALSAVLVVI